MQFGGKNLQKIKNRDNPNDRIYTPKKVAQLHVSIVNSILPFKDYDDVYEPFAGKFIYKECLEEFNENLFVKWSEIDLGRDFFNFDNGEFPPPKYIISNPPYSILSKIIKKCVQIKPKCISFLLNVGSVSIPRLRILSEANYELVGIHFLRVKNWFGVSAIYTFINTSEKLTKKISFSEIEFSSEPSISAKFQSENENDEISDE